MTACDLVFNFVGTHMLTVIPAVILAGTVIWLVSTFKEKRLHGRF
jgi:hypothetical protein